MEFEQNVHLFRLINNLGKEYSYLNPTIVFIAEYTVYLLLLSVIMYWFTRTYHNRIMIISASIAFILAEVIGKLVGKIYSNNQPFAELENVNQLIEKTINNSFPSDHTIVFFAFCFTFFLYNKTYKNLWIMLACLVALSRIWVGVHYPADVLVGGFIAIITAFICYKIIPKSDFIKRLLASYEKVEGYVIPRNDKSKGV